MLEVSTPTPGVTRLHMWSRVGRMVGYTVSAWVVRGILVDTGHPAAGRDLAVALERHPVRGALVTHAHEDHAGNATLLAARGVPVVAGDETLARMERAGSIPAYRRAVWGSPAPLPSPAQLRVGAGAGAFDPDGLELIAAPGHSSDHHVVWDAGRGHLYGGDLFLGVKVRLAHRGEDPRALVGTLRRLARLGPELLLDAHRGPVERPVPLLEAKADWLEGTIGTIDRLADAGVDEREIRRRVLGGESWIARGSRGEFSSLNLVRAVVAGRARATA